jgi:hypothetical protein
LARLSTPGLTTNGDRVALEVAIAKPLNAGQFDTWRTLWRSSSSSSSSSSGSGKMAHLGVDAAAGRLALVKGAPPPPWATEDDAAGASEAGAEAAAALWATDPRANPERVFWASPATPAVRGSSGHATSASSRHAPAASRRVELVLWAEGPLELRARHCPWTHATAAGEAAGAAGWAAEAETAEDAAAATGHLSSSNNLNSSRGNSDATRFLDMLALLGCAALAAALGFLVHRSRARAAERRSEGRRRRQQQQQRSSSGPVPTGEGLDGDAAAFAAYIDRTAMHYGDEIYGEI